MAKSHPDLALHQLPWIIVVVVLTFPATISAVRNAGLPEKFLCRTTVQGRYLISDDNGYTCTPITVDKWTRCCPKTRDRFSCQGCNLVSKCCNSYEYCVSCCLNPYRTHKDVVLKVKIAKPVTAGDMSLRFLCQVKGIRKHFFRFSPLFSGTYASVFDFCAGRCRHNSASVVHENAYASDFHHCFSLRSNSSGLTELNSEGRLSGIDVVIGRQGESCNSVCRLRGQSCVPNRLFVLNKCEILQRYMSCQGSCFASVGSDQPAEVLDDAPKHMNPGACLYTQDESMLSCDGSHQHTKRLCPCA